MILFCLKFPLPPLTFDSQDQHIPDEGGEQGHCGHGEWQGEVQNYAGQREAYVDVDILEYVYDE
jgi:hypothetical protein